MTLGAKTVQRCALIGAALGLTLLCRAIVTPMKAVLAPLLIAEAFSEGGEGQPWPGADWRVAGRLTAPTLQEDRFILEGATHRALAFGPTLERQGAALVMFGHRDTHFGMLQALTMGDELHYTLRGAAESAAYRVDQIWTAHKDALYLPGGGQDAGILLVTCYPFGGLQLNRPDRFLVWLVPV